MRFQHVILLALLVFLPRLAWASDTDGDGLQDEWELSYFVSLAEVDGEDDPDGDTLTNSEEEQLGTDPTREDTDGDGLDDALEVNSAYALDPTSMDTDGDFLMDGEELQLGTDPTSTDSDADGLTDYIEQLKGYDPLVGDSDGGGVWDGEEVLVDKTDPLEPSDDLMDSDNDGITNYYEAQLGTNPFAADTDGDWLSDGEEDADADGVWEAADGETNPLDPDTDGDGLHDGWEIMVYQTDAFGIDSDGDFLLDGEEHALRLSTYPCLHPGKLDSDQDGLTDGEEINVLQPSDPCLPDGDGDGLLDISEAWDGTDPGDGTQAAADSDGDGLSDAYETDAVGSDPADPDTDGDGLDDAEELLQLADGFATDPVDADTDDDGILDGNEGGYLTEDGLKGGPSPVEWDTDGDGLPDGQERGLTEPEFSAKDPDATDLALFVADTDPESTTFPADADTDNDGLKDGVEDLDGDGAVGPGESDPELFDTDGDGMDDYWETQYSTEEACGQTPHGPLDPLDPSDKLQDQDGDGLTNLAEYQLTSWEGNQEVKNQTNPCAKDSDGDGLEDKTEVYGKYDPGNPTGEGTNPNVPDTDGDGLDDGEEDADHNGKWNPLNETNPTQTDTDGDNLNDGFEGDVVGTEPTVSDTDGDGLDDGTEYNLFGTDPLDPDTDKDGLPDGLETGVPWIDDCPASKSNPHLADSDNDGLSDGDEDANQDGCWDKDDGETNPLDPDSDGDKLSDGLETGQNGDADPGSTTDPLAKDSDQDGLWDSHEDKDKNGAVDPGETDPNDKDTDDGGVADGTEVIVDGTDPLDPLDDLVADPDGDGLTNGEEKTIGTNPYDADSDGDTITDTVEVGENHLSPPDSDEDGIIDAMDVDSDMDGILDEVEAGDSDPATDPVDSDGDETPDYLDDDSDADGLSDALEWSVDADGDGLKDTDADGDGTPNYLDQDSDNAQGTDTEEGTGDDDNDGIANFVDPVDDPEEDLDFDKDGLTNQQELEETGTDPYNADTDGDGLNDKVEVEGPTSPFDADADDDGLADGDESALDVDGDGLIGVFDPDSDDDGLFDGTEAGVTAPLEDETYTGDGGDEYSIYGTNLARGTFQADFDPTTTTGVEVADSDGDGAPDGAEDPNFNGKVDVGEMDPNDADNLGLTPDQVTEFLVDDDGDGLTNRQEFGLGLAGTDPDLDDDGLLDGSEHNWRCDTDGDGLLNFLDPDADGDGLPDGLEQGLVAPTDPAGTELLYRHFRVDAEPATTTWALLPDSDGDGLSDGWEDANRNGLTDGDESDPNSPDEALDPPDSDGDGLTDAQEQSFGSDPEDGDSDDDGVPDGAEANPFFDLDHDGLPALRDPDADNDGLPDGLEMGLTDAGDDTDLAAGRFAADADPATTTWPTRRDSDGSGVPDGGEDSNHNGKVDDGEGDPLVAGDDYTWCTDTDGDGLCNAEEEAFGSDPFDVDSDDDGLFDGDEHNWNFDQDGDSIPSVFDPDSDDDGLPDGLEMGISQAVGTGAAELDGESVVVLGTDLGAGLFVKDSDPSTTTFMLLPDTDRGGLDDGVEDHDGNGRVDDFETDPRNPADDAAVDDDLDGDGLSNGLELELGTDPNNPDSDGDTIPDGTEVGDDTDHPLDTDGDETIDALDTDSDGDTLLDALEAGDDQLDTPPVDTDGDGLPDYRDTDSDDDTLTDEEEATWYHSDPTLKDTDGGGADDALEVTEHFTDPNDPADDFMGWFEEDSAVQGGVACGASAEPGGPGAGMLLLVLLLGLLAWRRHLASLVLLVLVLAPTAARADYTPDPVMHPDARQTALDANPFRLTPDGEGILSVHGARLATHAEFRVRLDLHYAAAPLTIVRDGTVLRTLVDHRTEAQLAAAIGLVGFLEFGLHAPFVLYQQARYPGMKLGDVGSMGIGHLTAFAKVQALDPDRFPVGLALYLPAIVPTGNTDAYMGYDGWGFQPTLALTTDLDPVLLALNVSYLLQPEATVNNLVDDDRLQAGAGLSYRITSDLSLALEATAATRAFAPFEAPEELQAELDAGLKYRIGHFRITAGAGKGLASGYATPNYRVFAGVEYALAPNPDRDGDGIPNLQDGCPDQAEDFDKFQDKDGCPDPDNDQDRILDPKDNCPNQAEDFDGFQDQDGCPDKDNDNDGILDEQDECPRVAEDLDNFQDEDGCPDKDNDNDGILDPDDKCPNEPETLNDYKDEDGCPDKKLAEFQKEARRIQILDKVHFKFMSAEIQPNSFELLDQIAQILLDNPQVLFVQVEGHTDRTGDSKFNMSLSKDRARAVVAYLVKKGVETSRLGARGYGDSRPIDYRVGTEANFNNRRVEFNILKYSHQ